MNTQKILIVEDDDNIRRGLEDSLSGEGYEVISAQDGQEGIETFEGDDWDLVLLDVMMPKMSGYDVCRAIRKIDECTPILFLTAKGEEIDKVLGLELGADDYLTKPFSIRELHARIAAILRRTRISANADNKKVAALPDSFRFGSGKVDRKRLEYNPAKGSAIELTGLSCAALPGPVNRP